MAVRESSAVSASSDQKLASDLHATSLCVQPASDLDEPVSYDGLTYSRGLVIGGDSSTHATCNTCGGQVDRRVFTAHCLRVDAGSVQARLFNWQYSLWPEILSIYRYLMIAEGRYAANTWLRTLESRRGSDYSQLLMSAAIHAERQGLPLIT